MKSIASSCHRAFKTVQVYSDRGTHDFSGAGLGMKGHEAADESTRGSGGPLLFDAPGPSEEHPRSRRGFPIDLGGPFRETPPMVAIESASCTSAPV